MICPTMKRRSLLTQAKEDFAKLDIPVPSGFIAPAWLLGPAASAAVHEARFCIHDLADRGAFPRGESSR